MVDRRFINIYWAPNDMSIRIVTDSTSDIPIETAAEHNITVVPAYVNIGEESFLDGVELSRSDFYKGLPGYTTHPTTAAPAPGAFTDVYNLLAGDGATEILSIHISENLSGILNAARIGAAETAAVNVTFVDSEQLTMGLGLLAITAANFAAAGKRIDQIVSSIEERIPRTFVFGLLDTLEYLRRSGRLGWAEFGFGTLLNIKPMVRVHTGNVEMLEKVRTSKRALSKMINLIEDLGALEQMALLHIGGGKRLDAFKKQTQHLYPENEKPLAVELTPALGAHIGPGGLGVACIVAEDN
ncbi:MAG: DegV family protein [Anaerolineae bacterium]|nr:MAG: DegV family protein [Anaerolineae bacterium]